MKSLISFHPNDLDNIPPRSFNIIENCVIPRHTTDATRKVKPTSEEFEIYKEYEEGRKQVSYMKLPYRHFADLNRMKPDYRTCSNRYNSPNLLFKEMGRFTRNQEGYDVLTLPAGSVFFKGTPYFHTNMRTPTGEAIEFMWVGNALTAAMYAERYQGGIMVYKTTRDIKLMILSYSNCVNIYGKTPWSSTTHTALSPDTRRALELKFGVGISLKEQVARVREILQLSDDAPLPLYRSRDLRQFTYCAPPIKTRDFGRIENDLVVAEFFRARKSQLGVDGWFSPECFTPFHCRLKEEILIFPSCLELFVKHPLYWKNWFDYLPISRLPAEPFNIQYNYKEQNRGMRIFKYVTMCEDAKPSTAIKKLPDNKRIPLRSKLVYMTYNVFNLEPPNDLVDRDEACRMCSQMIKHQAPDVVALHKFPATHSDLLTTLLGGAYHIGCSHGIAVLVSKHVVTKAPPIEVLDTDSVCFKVGRVSIAAITITDTESYRQHFTTLPIDLFVSAFHINEQSRLTTIKASLDNMPDVILGCMGVLHTSARTLLGQHGFSCETYTRQLKHGTTYNGMIEDHILLKESPHKYTFNALCFGQSPYMPVIGFPSKSVHTV